jgi:signal transduction histidine kinase
MRLRPWLWPAVLFVLTLAGFAAGLLLVDRLGEAAITRQQTAIAVAARDYFVAFAHEEGVAALGAALNRHARVAAPGGFRYALVDDRGRMLAGSNAVSSLDAPAIGWSKVIDPDSSPPRPWQVLAQPLGGGKTLIVAEDLAARDALRDAILRGYAVATVIAILVAALAGLALHALLIHRTRDIARTAGRIVAGDLTARAPHLPGGDAFDELAGAINAMLARIEELMTGMQMVTDSLAHDLRSPLTRAQSALDRAAAADAPDTARAEALDTAQREVDTVLATLSALLDIARAESGLSREMMRCIDVRGLALQMSDLFAPSAEDAGQTLTVEVPHHPMVAWAHETLLRQSIGNLLHNALVHAGDGAHVVLTVSEPCEGMVRVAVSDDGPGVPAEHLGAVRQRFVRLDAARSRPGSGLGLALVAACAKLHRGRLTLEDNHPGLRTLLELPTAR